MILAHVSAVLMTSGTRKAALIFCRISKPLIFFEANRMSVLKVKITMLHPKMLKGSFKESAPKCVVSEVITITVCRKEVNGSG